MTQPTIDFIQSAAIMILSGGLFFLAVAVLRLRNLLIIHQHNVTINESHKKYICDGKIFNSFVDAMQYVEQKEKGIEK